MNINKKGAAVMITLLILMVHTTSCCRWTIEESFDNPSASSQPEACFSLSIYMTLPQNHGVPKRSTKASTIAVCAAWLLAIGCVSCCVNYGAAFTSVSIRNNAQRPVHLFSSASSKIVLDGARTTASQHLPLDNAVQELKLLLTANSTEAVHVEGYVVAKRGFGSSFAFLDVTDSFHWETPVQVMLKRQAFHPSPPNNSEETNAPTSDSSSYFDGYMQSMVPGIFVRIAGIAAPSRNPGEALLLAQTIRLLRLPPTNPQHVAVVLRAARNGLLPSSYVLHAAVASACPTYNDDDGPLLLDVWTTQLKRTTVSASGLAKDMIAAFAPPCARYPTEILARKNDRGVYTLPAPDDGLIDPPLSVIDAAAWTQHHTRQTQTEVGRDVPVVTVQELIRRRTSSINGPNNSEESVDILSLDAVSGWIQNRRRFLGNITVLELVQTWERVAQADAYENRTEHEQLWTSRLKCVLHPKVMRVEDVSLYAQILARGAQAQLVGYYRPNSDGEKGSPDLFWVTDARLLRSTWRPSVVQFMLELVAAHSFDSEEAAIALGQTDAEMESLLQLPDQTARQWRAAEISRDLQDTESRMVRLDSTALSVLDDFDKLRTRYPIHKIDSRKSAETEGAPASRWKRKKEPQLDWMAQQVKSILERHIDFGKRTFTILDVGGGKGYLANHLASTLRDFKLDIQVIDIAQRAIKNGAMRSKRLNLPVSYSVGDASTADFSDQHIDLVVALHACGALTDVALGHAVANRAAFVICPCCFRSNPWLQIPLSTRNVDDWLNVDPAKYDSLKLLAEVQGDIQLASRAIHTICALRASAVETRSHNLHSVSVKMFPIAFSTRNVCLVGNISR